MNQTWENTDFGLFGPYLGPQNFLCEFYLY